MVAVAATVWYWLAVQTVRKAHTRSVKAVEGMLSY